MTRFALMALLLFAAGSLLSRETKPTIRKKTWREKKYEESLKKLRAKD